MIDIKDLIENLKGKTPEEKETRGKMIFFNNDSFNNKIADAKIEQLQIKIPDNSI